jgi:xylan 1,4-beta-xylosidase
VTSRPVLLVSALVISFVASSTADAQTLDTVTIDIDAAAPGTPLQPVWSYFGYDEANTTTTPEGYELLRTLSAVQPSPVHIRTHFLFNTGDGAPSLKWGSTNIYTEDERGNAIYSYALIDQIMDATVDAGATPLIELGFMPQALSTQPEPYENSNPYVLDSGSFYPPRDYEKWGTLVTEWATHVKERYPNAESNWQWELWNEPDIAYWRGTFEEYARLYDVTEAALHSVFPEAPLGGPAVANPENGFLTQFLQHCATGTNAVTGQTGTRLDMVSFHAKGGVRITDGHVRMDLGNQLRLHRAGFDAVAGSAFADTPIVISEADPDGCAACPVSTAPHHAYRNSPAYGAYEVAMMKRSLDLADQAGVNLRGVLTWSFTFPNTPYFAGYRALSTNGLHLPVLNAFKLLGSLSGDRLAVTSSGALPLSDLLEGGARQQPDVDALAVIDDKRIQILVWNYHDDLSVAAPTALTLNVAVAPGFGTQVAVTHTRVDELHGDTFSVWEAQGRPVEPTDAQLVELREAMEPVVLTRRQPMEIENGSVTLSFDLPRFGISLVILEPNDGSEAHPTAASKEPSDCGCRLVATERTPPLSALYALPLFALLARLKRHT